MLHSMTGFGKGVASIGGKIFSAEVRSLNGKYLDLSLKIPSILKDREADLRNLLSEKVMRGKVDFVIEIQSGETAAYSINKNAFRQYYAELESLAEELGVPVQNLFETIMKIPDVLSASGEQMSDREYSQLVKLVEQSLANLNHFRRKEGKLLEEDMLRRITQIKQLSRDVKKIEGKRKEQIRRKLKEKFTGLIASREADEMRLEQELVLYAERFDITEELVRLESHCNYFLEVLRDGEISKGKKLSFILQEIGREINTLGAKANDAALQKLVIEMKEELEKVKEQVNNVL